MICFTTRAAQKNQGDYFQPVIGKTSICQAYNQLPVVTGHFITIL